MTRFVPNLNKFSVIPTPERRLSIYPPAKARRSRFERPDRGGGHGGAERRRARRVGTRSGYGSTGGRGFFGGAVAVRSRCGPDPALCEKHSHTVLDGRYRGLHGTVYMPSLGGALG
jgi:hypothetical protein